MSHVSPANTNLSLEVRHVRHVLTTQVRRFPARRLLPALATPVLLDHPGARVVRLVHLVKTESVVYVMPVSRDQIVSHVSPANTNISLEMRHVRHVLTTQVRRFPARCLRPALATPVLLDYPGARAQSVLLENTKL